MLALATFATAQQPTQAQSSAIRQSCRSDFQAHCAGVPTGGKEALDCLKQNASVSSAACQKALAALGSNAASAPASAAAAGPAAAAAPAPASGQGPISGDISPQDGIRILRNNCQADYRRLCNGVEPGGGRAVACLKTNAAALSPGCQSALMAAQR